MRLLKGQNTNQRNIYGKGVQVGPVGDVLQISNASNNNGTFKQNLQTSWKHKT